MFEGFQAHVGGCCHFCRINARECSRKRAALGFSDESAQSQCDQPLGPGAKRNPLIRFGSGLRHAGFKLDEIATLFRIPTAHPCVFTRIGNGGKPGFEEIRAKGNDHVRAAKIKGRHAGLTKKAFSRLAQCCPRLEHAQCAEPDGSIHPGSVGKVGNEVKEMVGSRTHQEGDLIGFVIRERVCHGLDGGVPIHRLCGVASTGSALDRVCDTIGVVQSLQGCLPACAGLAKVKRMICVTLNLECSSLKSAEDESAPCRTFAASCGVISALTNCIVFGHLLIGFPFHITGGRPAARQHGSGCRAQTSQLQKITPGKLLTHMVFLSPGLVVARATIGKFCQQSLIITGRLFMTIDTPAHVEYLWILIDGHLA